jgi:outer membrane protein OmpA-like peptidoglycan-associated protein
VCSQPISDLRLVFRNIRILALAVLTAAGRTTLNQLLTTLRRYPNAQIRIEGYTDSDGTFVSNLSLSRARAATVRRYFVGHGVHGVNLASIGFGENRPVASNRARPARRRTAASS